MSNFIRTLIFKKVIKPLDIDNVCQYKIMSNLYVTFKKKVDTYTFVLPLKSKNYDLTNKIENINDLRSTFDNVAIENNIMYFNVLRDNYIKQILENNMFGVSPPLADNCKNIIVEFSSPNIAKPFHMGHLRSTIIGNYIANLNSFLQNQVTKINYLGDWGTQFGYVYIGMKMKNIDNIEMHTDPIKTLYTSYVDANKLAESNPNIHKRAREIFQQLEFEDDEVYKNWEKIKQFTVLELEKTYKRLSVIFDQYEWESMYTAKKVNKIINKMEEMQLLKLDNDNRKVIAVNKEKNPVSIMKSDGTSLYISRDIAAAIDRFERYNFDAMCYIVENGQTDHFNNLIQILNKMNLSWADRLKHVKFGRVHGMSTRKGTAVFLEDILNKAKEIMKERQLKTKTTKIPLDKIDESSDILGVSGVIIQDLKQSRMNNYKFDWDLMLNMKGDSGIKLQYTHCRLCSLGELSDTLVTECDSTLLKEPEVDQLILLISQFDEAVLKSYEELEPHILTIYLFRLCKAINMAWHELTIKNESKDLRNQRLLLFHTAKIILAQGMKLLGLTPLEKM